MATQTWHPPRWLSQLEAVSARNLLLAEGAPPPAAYFSLCVPSGPGGQCCAVYRSEAVSGTIAPEWMPLSWPLDLQLGSTQSEVVLALHQLDASSCTAAASPLSVPHFWPRGTPGCTLQQQQPSQAQLGVGAEAIAHGSTCSGDGAGSAEAAQHRDAEAGEGAAMATTVLDHEVAFADMGAGSPAADSAAGTSSSPQPSGEAGPQSEPLPPLPQAARQLEPEQQQQLQQQQQEEDRGGGASCSSATTPAAAATPALDSFPPDLFPGQVLAAWVVDLNRLHPVGEDLAAAAVGPNSVIIEMEDGTYMYPPPAEEPTPSQQSSPSKLGTALGGERLQASAGSSPAGSAPRRLATLLMSKLMRSTPNLQEAGEGRAGAPAGDSEEEWEAVSEASASSRFTTHTVPRESSTLLPPPSGITMSASGLTKPLSVSELQLSAAALVGLRSSILQLHGRALELRGRLEQLVEDRQAALEQEQQVREAVRAGQRARQRAQQVQARLGKLQQELGAASKAATVRAQALVTTLKVMQASDRKLRDAQESLQGGQGRERLTGLHRELVARRCLMVSDLGRIFQLGPITVKVLEAPPGGYLEDRLERQWTGGAATSSSTPTSTSAAPDDGGTSIKSAGGKLQLQAAFPGSSGFDELAPNGGSSALGTPRQYRQEVRLSICGVELRPAVWRAAFEDVGSDITAVEDEAAAVALGYVVQMLQRLSVYLDVPLRYPLRFLGSKSSILDGTPPIGTWSLATGPAKRTLFGRSESSAGEAAAAAGLQPTEYPLHCGGRRERAQFAVGVFLLNKDVVQLLQAHGISAGGPNQLLNNLYKLLLAARSALPQHS